MDAAGSSGLSCRQTCSFLFERCSQEKTLSSGPIQELVKMESWLHLIDFLDMLYTREFYKFYCLKSKKTGDGGSLNNQI